MIQPISYLNQAQFKSSKFYQQKQNISEIALSEKMLQTEIPISAQRAYALAFCKNHQANISFKGRIEEIKMSELNPIDRGTMCKPLIQTTWLFRKGLTTSLDKIMRTFSDKLAPQKAPSVKPVKFYIYGCSEGHETYSTIMYLVKKYGSLEEAKKRVKIRSIDIPSPGLNMAGTQQLRIDKYNFAKLSDAYKRILKSISSDEDIYSKINAGQSLNIKDEVFEYANFKEGRIIEDFSKNRQFNRSEPEVIFFRSALPYIRPKQASRLIDNLYSKLPEGSFFCIGELDYTDVDGKRQLNKVKNTFKPAGTEDSSGKEYLFRKPYMTN